MRVVHQWLVSTETGGCAWVAGRHVPAWAAAVRSQGCVAHIQLVKPARSPTTPFVNRTPSHPAPPSSCSGLTKDGACVPCNGNEDGGVMDCDAAGKATDCYGGWFLKGGACVKCSEHCSDCTDEKTCNSCECGGGAGSGRGRGGGGAQFSVYAKGRPRVLRMACMGCRPSCGMHQMAGFACEANPPALPLIQPHYWLTRAAPIPPPARRQVTLASVPLRREPRTACHASLQTAREWLTGQYRQHGPAPVAAMACILPATGRAACPC